VKHAAVYELKTSLLINTDTDVAVLAISMFEKLEKDRSLLQRTFSLCVKQTHLDGCIDAIRSARKEDNSFFLSFIRKKIAL
jgi:hypothetical protein